MFEEIRKKSWDFIIDKLLNTQNNITEIETNGNIMHDDSVSLFIKKEGRRIEIKDVWADSREYANHIGELIDLLRKDDDSHIIPKDNDNMKFLMEGRIYLDTGETARVHIVLPPASDFPQVTIAKKSKALGTLDALRKRRSFNDTIMNFLEAAVDCNFTMVLSGGTGAGKTTLLEAMTKDFKDDERIGIVEDSQELQLIQPNVTYLHSTLWKPGSDKNSVATLSWCVQQLNRQRVDKIIIGETRGGEFYDFIVAANSGCEGSLTTIHANNPKMALQKMSNFMLIGQPQPMRSANQSIGQTVDLILQLGFNSRHENRLLRIENVSETLNADESASIATNPLFIYNDENDSWDFKFLDDNIRNKLKSHGYDTDTFTKTSNSNSVPHIPDFRKFNFGR